MAETVADLKVSGNELFKAGKFSEAVEKYSRGLEIEPDNHLLFSNRSLAHCSAGNYENAINDAKKCIELMPSFVKGYYRLANAYMQAGQIEEAQSALADGYKIDPNNGELKKLEKRIQPSTTSEQKELDAATRKEAQELSQLIASKQRDLREARGRSQACRRDAARLELTKTEVETMPEDCVVYSAVGKAFLLDTKEKIVENLQGQLTTNQEMATAVSSRQDALVKDIKSAEVDLRALVR